MSSIATPARTVSAPSTTVRHGTCRCTVEIRGVEYRLRPMAAPPGFHKVYTLRKIGPQRAVYTVAHEKGQQPACTCPDHEINKCTCKHVMALAAIGLIAKPKAARPVKASTRAAHARARKALAEREKLTPEQRRHLAEMALPEGWQPGGAAPAAPVPAAPVPAAPAAARAAATAAPSFAEGFRQAVADHIARKNGTAAPAEEWPICDGCGCDFDPEISRDPSFCEACMAVGGAA
jgi:hypothetical protein